MTVGQKIKLVRQQKKISQQKLGDMLGVSQAMIAQYEKGDRNPKIETLQRIAIALEVPITSLAEYETPLDNAFSEVHAYQATEEQKYKIFLELLRSMGYIVEFNGCPQIKDLCLYEEDLKEFYVNNRTITSCSLNRDGCEQCSKRKYTYYQLTKDGKKVKIKYSTMLAFLTMSILQIEKFLTTIFENGDM